MTDSEIIDKLGGPGFLADLFDISSQAVSQWRSSGIPNARRMYLELRYPQAFQPAKPTNGSVENNCANG